MFKHREYKSGTNWCLWRWSFVPTGYITRLHLIKTPWFAVCLHWLNAPDPEPYLHDHPVSFLSIILKGRYIEERPGTLFMDADWNIKKYVPVYLERNWFNYLRAADAHSIKEVDNQGTLTLCFMGPKVRDWGYFTDKGWVYWKNYNREKYGVGKAS